MDHSLSRYTEEVRRLSHFSQHTAAERSYIACKDHTIHPGPCIGPLAYMLDNTLPSQWTFTEHLHLLNVRQCCDSVIQQEQKRQTAFSYGMYIIGGVGGRE